MIDSLPGYDEAWGFYERVIKEHGDVGRRTSAWPWNVMVKQVFLDLGM